MMILIKKNYWLFSWHEDGTMELLMKLTKIDLPEHENPEDVDESTGEADNVVEVPSSSHEPQKFRRISRSTDDLSSKRSKN